MAKAPVCHVPPEDVNIPQPPGSTLPPIPQATDLRSALAAIAALTQTIRIITNQIDNRGILNGFNRKPDPNQPKPQWVEKSRVEDTVKIYQNNDPSTGNFVEVKQINRLVMVDKNTGNGWTWDRDRK